MISIYQILFKVIDQALIPVLPQWKPELVLRVMPRVQRLCLWFLNHWEEMAASVLARRQVRWNFDDFMKKCHLFQLIVNLIFIFCSPHLKHCKRYNPVQIELYNCVWSSSFRLFSKPNTITTIFHHVQCTLYCYIPVI